MNLLCFVSRASFLCRVRARVRVQHEGQGVYIGESRSNDGFPSLILIRLAVLPLQEAQSAVEDLLEASGASGQR